MRSPTQTSNYIWGKRGLVGYSQMVGRKAWIHFTHHRALFRRSLYAGEGSCPACLPPSTSLGLGARIQPLILRACVTRRRLGQKPTSVVLGSNHTDPLVPLHCNAMPAITQARGLVRHTVQFIHLTLAPLGFLDVVPCMLLASPLLAAYHFHPS